MPAIVRLNKQGLNDLIDNIRLNGGDTTELEELMSGVVEDQDNHRPVKRRQATMQIEVEEPTTEERLEAKVGELFPGGITETVLAQVIDFDRNHTLAEIKKMCVEAELSPSGAKKELAAKLIAKGVL